MEAATQQVTTLASTGLKYPAGVAVDGAGHVYIADTVNNAVKEIPYAFIGPSGLTEPASAGSDVLLPMLPSTTSLTGVFAPTSDQNWLTIGTIANGSLGFSFTANATASARVAHLTVLGQQITVTQSGAPPVAQAQTITFGALANQPYGASPFTVSATASSGLTVSFASTTPSVCTVSGATVTLLAVGACTIQATQAGNGSYLAAPPVNQSFTVGAQTIAFAALSNEALYGAPFTVSATASSGLTVTFASATPSVCTVSGATVALVAIGTCTLQATQAGSSTYAPATVSQTFQVTLRAASLLVGSAAGSSSYLLATNSAWTASSNASFLHISAGSAGGTGSALVVFTYDAFTGTGTRTGTLTVAGVSVTVTQVGSTYLKAGSMVTLVSSGLSSPGGVAVDGAGNVYIADYLNNAIKEWNAATQQVTTLVSSGLWGPTGPAVDGSGNVYFADNFNNAVKEWIASTQQVTTLVASGLNAPGGVAVDGSGNVYIADYYNNAIKEWSAATQQVTTLVSSGLNGPTGVAVDGSGNVYIADDGNNAIKEWSASTQQVTTLISGLNGPARVAVDGSGNVYIAAYSITHLELIAQLPGFSAVLEWSAATQQLTTLAGWAAEAGPAVAVDGAGNVYIADANSNAVKEIPYAFVGPSSLTEAASAGSDSLQVRPSTASLSGLFAPSSDQSWLTIGTIASGIVGFSFTANTTASARVAHITILGQQITVTQNGSAAAQTITFGALANQPFGASPFTVSAMASSGLTVSFASTTPSVCSVSGATVTLLALGACTIQATQAGNGSYLAAQPASQSFAVGSQTIAFAALANEVFNGAPFTVSATSSSGLTVTFASTTPSICTVSGATVTLIWAGTCTIQATQAGNANYTPATASQSFQVSTSGVGNNTIIVGPAAGTSSLLFSTNSAWTATSGSFTHIAPGSASGTGSAAVVFTYDAFTTAADVSEATDTRSDVLVIGGLPFVVIQVGTDYMGPGPVVSLGFGGSATGVAVDGSGNVYDAGYGTNQVQEWNGSTQQVTTLAASGLNQPAGVAVDGSGNVFIADQHNNALKEWSASTHQVTTLAANPELFQPAGMAVDASGNAYVVAGGCVYEWTVSTQRLTGLVCLGLNLPQGVAVDAIGNIYIADTYNGAVKKWNVSTQQMTTLVSSGLSEPYAVAVDPSGNVYIADSGNNAIKEWSASTQQVTTLVPSGLNQPYGVAVDVFGNVYIANYYPGFGVKEMPNAFVGPASFTEPSAAGSDSLLPVVPSITNLTGLFAPTSDQSWLTIGTIQNGVVHFSFTANTTGSFRVAHIAVLGHQITVTQSGSPAAQTITFGALSNQPYGAAPFTVSATASSGLAVSFASTTASVCTVSGSTVTIVGAGSCSIQATQAGNANYAAATPVTQSFTVSAAAGSLGTLTAGSTTVAPGSAFSIPISLALNGAVSVDALTFAVQITPNGGAPALTGSLRFTAASSIVDTPFTSSGGTSNAISVVWSSLTTPLSGTSIVGIVSGAMPAGAVSGQSYAVVVTGAGAGTGINGATAVPLSTGPNGAVSTSFSYLVGDVAPYTSDWAPSFGDGNLNILDLIQELFAVNSVPGFRPATCSDRFDAMDSYPLDSGGVRGGDGVLDIRDLIEELFRANNLDTSRPVRSSLGGALPWASCASGSSGNSMAPTAVNRNTAAAARPQQAAQGTLALGSPERTGDGKERVPVYLEARSRLTGVAVTFGLGDQHSQLRFVATPETPPSLAHDSQLGVVVAAWLNGVSVPAGGRLQLGYVEGPVGIAANLKVYGASASGVADNREVRLETRAAAAQQ